jgi:lipid-binding SYLF domain-containing protein
MFWRTRDGDRHVLYVAQGIVIIVKVLKFGVVRGYHG